MDPAAGKGLVNGGALQRIAVKKPARERFIANLRFNCREAKGVS